MALPSQLAGLVSVPNPRRRLFSHAEKLIGAGLYTCLSPNACALFSLDENALADILYMQFADPRTGFESLDEGEHLCIFRTVFILKLKSQATLTTVNEALVTQLAIACRGVSSEDVLATAQLFSRQCLTNQMHMEYGPSVNTITTFNRALISGVYRISGVPLDHALLEQPDSTAKNMLLQRCLGIQAAVDFQGEAVVRRVQELVASVTFNLRYIFFALSYSFIKKASGDIELKKPGSLLLCHLCFLERVDMGRNYRLHHSPFNLAAFPAEFHHRRAHWFA